VNTFPLHAKHAAGAIEHGTNPAAIVITTDDVERTNLASCRVQLVDKGKHLLLMRHRDQQAGKISHGSCACNERGQIGCLYPERDADSVYAVFAEEMVQELRRFGRSDRIA
jgi:hypothetical protein